MMARQFDTVGKHSDCYRPIPVHTPSSNRRLQSAKSYVNQNSETSISPRCYETDYDYKTTHYPSYPSNYPYDDAKYKYDAQSYNHYEKQTFYGGGSYDDATYESRNYVSSSHPTNSAASAYAPNDQEYVRYGNYEISGRSSYPTTETPPDYTEKTRYPSSSGGGGGGYAGGSGYDRTYYESDSRYLSNESGRHGGNGEAGGRYADSRHSENRNNSDNRDGDLRYSVEGRDNDRRYSTVDSRDDDGRDPDSRYSVDGRAGGVDGRFNDTSRYQAKENYYDRYYKHRPSRDHHHHHHASETSRY